VHRLAEFLELRKAAGLRQSRRGGQFQPVVSVVMNAEIVAQRQ
jgi:hypothetical protein